jgi:hypothetical protein
MSVGVTAVRNEDLRRHEIILGGGEGLTMASPRTGCGYRSVITNPLRSAATISPDWKPDSVSTAPF